ncbi:putative solute carrier family 28 member 3 isoform X3 [Apostichopus japonicus]|uniref:Putative solute carrier family 28 member 3 isoform X3 n=1 Tax=Stichopus japonicus TaxID=307972 RepID=A0A2G8LRM8_STIJA|nr:putative solute carrier family 28 member 3 isoform X3 [Apostichopus japonicus]
MERPGYEDTNEDIFGAVFTDDIGKKRCSSKHDAKDEEELQNLNVIVQNEKALPVEDDEPQDIVSIIWNMFDEWTAVYRARVQRRRKLLLSFLLAILALLYLIGLLYAAVRNLEDASVMLVLTGLVFCVAVYYILKDKFGEAIWKNILEKPSYIFYDLDSKFKWFLFLIFAAIVFGIAVYLCRHNLYQLSSGAGLIGFMFIMFIFSKHPKKVKWRPVLWGVALQFVFGLIILRTEIGYNIFRWLGDLTQTFLDFSTGAKFLFGDPQYLDHFFTFKVSTDRYYCLMKFHIKHFKIFQSAFHFPGDLEGPYDSSTPLVLIVVPAALLGRWEVSGGAEWYGGVGGFWH